MDADSALLEPSLALGIGTPEQREHELVRAGRVDAQDLVDRFGLPILVGVEPGSDQRERVTPAVLQVLSMALIPAYRLKAWHPTAERTSRSGESVRRHPYTRQMVSV